MSTIEGHDCEAAECEIKALQTRLDGYESSLSILAMTAQADRIRVLEDALKGVLVMANSGALDDFKYEPWMWRCHAALAPVEVQP